MALQATRERPPLRGNSLITLLEEGVRHEPAVGDTRDGQAAWGYETCDLAALATDPNDRSRETTGSIERSALASRVLCGCVRAAERAMCSRVGVRC